MKTDYKFVMRLTLTVVGYSLSTNQTMEERGSANVVSTTDSDCFIFE